MNKGVIYAAISYVCWGLLPIYWKTLHEVPAGQILAHRIVWSLVFVGLVLAVRRHWGWLGGALHRPRVLLTFVLSGLLLGVNWFVYIWGVNAGFIVETSLGYFINPLVNVLLGYLILKEKLRGPQWLALSVALAGVLYLTFSYGAFPWIALTLAFTFGFYGLIRKTAALNSAEGLFLETAVLFLPALGFLLLQEMRGVGALAHSGITTNLLLMGAGVVTSVPLLLFASGARKITMTTLGLLQYIAPTLQFLIGVLIYHEEFGPSRVVGFGLIWLALILYSGEGLLRKRRQHSDAARALS
ncbi:MAG: EamA family transporter RarD [Candidatus Promineofilum sp.]|nr:EamA family transporter RarD [Promineifilum sp.]MBP9657705.1 EamA family transporter RarD [Promineifilum sp.]